MLNCYFNIVYHNHIDNIGGDSRNIKASLIGGFRLLLKVLKITAYLNLV